MAASGRIEVSFQGYMWEYSGQQRDLPQNPANLARRHAAVCEMLVYHVVALLFAALGDGGIGITTMVCGPPCMWVVLRIMVPFWIPVKLRQLIFRVPKEGL